MEPYILIILERAGNYNGIVCFVVIFLTTSKPHQKRSEERRVGKEC